MEVLNEGKALRSRHWNEIEDTAFRDLAPLTLKPAVWVVNVAEDDPQAEEVAAAVAAVVPAGDSVVALSAARWMGKGDGLQADAAAFEAMRKALDAVSINANVCVGRPSRSGDDAFVEGRRLGNAEGSSVRFDLAVDPLECVDSVATGRYNAMSVIAINADSTFLRGASGLYMDKIAVGVDAAPRALAGPVPRLAFGRGIHFCVGAPIARMEVRVALEALLARTRCIDLAPARPPAHAPSIFVRRLATLPLRTS